MRDEALSLISNVADPAAKLNLLREYVQAFSLRALHESEAFTGLAFVGGTALRFVWNLPRFSENLDFSVTDAAVYHPEKWLKKLKSELNLAGFDCSVRWKSDAIIQTAWLKIDNLLYPAGIGTRAGQKLSIKLEFDTRPPQGGEVERVVLQRHLMFAVAHYSLSCLFAGKVNAMLTRGYDKGRDWFDLLWLLGRRPVVTPNLEFLKNALHQFQDVSVIADDWAKGLQEKLKKMDVPSLADDVRPFLERPADRQLLTKHNIAAALEPFA